MAIRMQGTWQVSVKTKNAAFPQQFEISNALTGNGVYAGTHTGEITVTDTPGSSWAITIRHNPGTGFRSSRIKLKFPTIVAGFHQFDIQSNDSGGDKDFDDLVLTCRTLVSANDHLIYGQVSDYEGPCIFNPCFLPYLVLDTPLKLKEALRIPKLRDYLKEIRPEVLVRPPFPPDPIGPVSLNPQPFPPRDFTPIVVPLPGELATPLKKQFLVRTESKSLSVGSSKKQAAAESVVYQSVKSIVPIQETVQSIDPSLLASRAKLESIIARFRFCDSDSLPNIRVRFQEYDRTAAEKSGAAYTGEGARTNLGSTYTDDFGNYIFRFTTVPSDQVDEIVNDLAPGEDAFVQSAPDVIAQVMQPLNSAILAFETAPYWNIPTRKRINICVPREKIGIRGLPCNGQHILQGVGLTPLADLNPAGVRDGYGNVLDANGIITSTNSLSPRTECAAWTGTLVLQGCLNNASVKYYSLEHRQPGDSWQPLAHEFNLPMDIGVLRLEMPVFQGMDSGRAIYLNAETDTQGWVETYKRIKGKIPSTMFLENGPREIRITGLDATKNAIPNMSETLTLFILNNGIDLDIRPEVSMDGGGTISDCGLFTLPAGVENPALRVRFKANQVFAPPVYGFSGFMGAYQLSMQKGSTGGFATAPAMGSLPSGKTYAAAAGRGLSCDLSFRGTRDEVSADADYYIEVGLVAATPNTGWLETGQTFCAFSLNLSGHLRRTDGNSANWESWAVPVLFGIQR